MANITRPRSADALNNGAGRADVAVSGLAVGVTARHRAGRLWPFGVIAALTAAGAVLVVLLAIVVVLGVTAHWPDQRWQGWLMLGVVLLALAPLLLLILDRVASAGGFLEFRGLKIAFAAEAAGSDVTLPRNMGIPAGVSRGRQRGFPARGRDARDRRERRARRGSRRGIGLVGDASAHAVRRRQQARSGARRRLCRHRPRVARTFQGWASPGRLARAMLEASPELRRAADNAEVTARRWHLAYPPNRCRTAAQPNPAATLPPLLDPAQALAHVAFREPSATRSPTSNSC